MRYMGLLQTYKSCLPINERTPLLDEKVVSVLRVMEAICRTGGVRSA
jgi:hypothetical protein